MVQAFSSSGSRTNVFLNDLGNIGFLQDPGLERLHSLLSQFASGPILNFAFATFLTKITIDCSKGFLIQGSKQ